MHKTHTKKLEAGRKKYVNHSSGYEKTTQNYVSYYFNSVDNEFFDILDIDFISGRMCNLPGIRDSTREIIVNRKFTEFLGDDILGSIITPGFLIVGVVDDYRFLPLTEQAGAMAYYTDVNLDKRILVKYSGSINSELIDGIKGIYEEEFIGYPVSFSELSDKSNKWYEEFKQRLRLLRFIAIISILFMFLGFINYILLYLKENLQQFAIRRVFGASPSNLFLVMTRKIIISHIYGYIFAIPIVILLFKRYLRNFTTQINLGELWWIFLCVALILTSSLLLSVIFYVRKNVNVNVIDNLHYE